MTPGLIERLEAAGEGSRELDREVWRATGGWDGVDTPPLFTRSLDTALTLAERVLPGWLWSAGTSDDGTAIAVLDDLNASGGFAESRAKTPALALCIAILKARATQEQG